MCGIAGIWNFCTEGFVDHNKLEKMCKAISHRGPDAQGIHIEKDFGIAHTRLSILDVRGGSQPWTDPSKRVWVSFNGEIYNYEALRHEFEADGRIFQSDCDTEVIPYCYLKYEEHFAEHLEGMFAIAIWDNDKRELFLARDRMGEKPLLYAKTPTGFVFASEMRALLLGGVGTSLSVEALDAYLTLGFVPHTMCIFQGVQKLPPATILKVNASGQIVERTYWKVCPKINKKLTLEEAKEELEQLLRQAVRNRLHSDVPLGAFLSGGIDSSIMVALMMAESNKQVQTYCVGFAEDDYDERHAARQVAKHLGTDHHEEVVSMDATEVLPQLQRHYGEPFGDPSALPTYYLCQKTRQNVTVAISGDGGDELFAGYNTYRRFLIRQRLRWVAAQGPLMPILQYSARHGKHNTSSRLRRAWNTLVEASLPLGEQYSRLRCHFYPLERHSLYSNDLRTLLFRADPAQQRIEELFSSFADLDTLPSATLVDQQLYLPDDILVKVDIASMIHGLEVRCPLLDRRIVEFAASIPFNMKLSKGKSKLLLKTVARKCLPPETLQRRKQGFGVPVSDWLRLDLGKLAEEVLTDLGSRLQGLFRQDRIEQLLREHRLGRADHGRQLWLLLCLGLWAREFAVSR